MSFDRDQKRAVAHLQGPCMVLAGPGSGKTYTIAGRIKELVRKRKVRPDSILVITFTKDAAKEMKERYLSLMQAKGTALSDGCDRVTFGTFHAIFYYILKWAYGWKQGNFLTDRERYQLLSEIVTGNAFSDEFQNVEEEDFLRDLSEEIGNIKNNLVKIREYRSKKYQAEAFRAVYYEYEKRKRALGKIDFEDMLYLCYLLFKQHPDLLKKWQEKYAYILIDEFQDINQVQYEVIRMLAAPNNNLFVVGDDDQSIYGFRGAKPAVFHQFEEDYKDAKKVILGKNYRSCAPIVEGALRVIANNEERYEKAICPREKEGQDIRIIEVQDQVEECLLVQSLIKAAEKRGVDLREIAVLSRTAADAGLLTEVLLEYNIPFFMKEKPVSVYEHFIAKDLRAYLAMSQGEVTRRNFARVANKPNRYLKRESYEEFTYGFESVKNYYADRLYMQDRIEQLEWDLRMIRSYTPFAAIRYIRKNMEYDSYLRDYAKEHGISFQSLSDVLRQLEERAALSRTIPEWLKKSVDEEEGRTEKDFQNPEGVRLLSAHGAKGLEFDTVIILDVLEGSFPHKRAVTAEEIEEERRLFYVAMTRAKEELILLYPSEKQGKKGKTSRFIGELISSQKEKNDVE